MTCPQRKAKTWQQSASLATEGQRLVHYALGASKVTIATSGTICDAILHPKPAPVYPAAHVQKIRKWAVLK